MEKKLIAKTANTEYWTVKGFSNFLGKEVWTIRFRRLYAMSSWFSLNNRAYMSTEEAQAGLRKSLGHLSTVQYC